MELVYGDKVKVSLGARLYLGTYQGYASTCPHSANYRKVIVVENRTNKRMVVNSENVEKR